MMTIVKMCYERKIKDIVADRCGDMVLPEDITKLMEQEDASLM
jgi:hypothetical protein